MKRLWAAEDLSAVFDSLSLISLDADESPIIIDELIPGWTSETSHWHMHLIHSCWAFPKADGWPVWRKQHAILLSGLDTPWFCFGMLCHGFANFYFTRDDFVASEEPSMRDRSSRISAIYIPWLEKMLYGINDVAAYAHRFRRSSRGCELECYSGAYWMLNILRVVVECGLCDWSLLMRCPTITYDAVVAHLLDTGNFEVRENHLRIRK